MHRARFCSLILAALVAAAPACGGSSAPSRAPDSTPTSVSESDHPGHTHAGHDLPHDDAGHDHPHGEAGSSKGGMHHAAHGGIVKMHADGAVHLHVEVVVVSSGLVRLYPSDAASQPIPADELTGSVTCEASDTHEKITVKLTTDAADGSSTAQCKPLTPAGANVTFDVTLRGASFARSVTVGAGGTAGMEHH